MSRQVTHTKKKVLDGGLHRTNAKKIEERRGGGGWLCLVTCVR